MTTMEIILVTLVAAICGMGSVLDERQTHRPLVACTLITIATSSGVISLALRLLRLAPSASSWRACAKSPRGLARAAQRIAQKNGVFLTTYIR